MDSEIWFGIAKWARETGQLYPWQRSRAYNLGQRTTVPSVKHARQGLQIIEQVNALGFEVPEVS